MRALTEGEAGVLTGLMGDDAPEGFAEEVMCAYGPGSGWEAAEAYGGPCPHEGLWPAQCEGCPHEGGCGPFPSLFEAVVTDYLAATGRAAVADAGDGEIPF